MRGLRLSYGSGRIWYVEKTVSEACGLAKVGVEKGAKIGVDVVEGFS